MGRVVGVILELVFGFLLLVAASYVGTTMALRGFFGRERYGPSSTGERDDLPESESQQGNNLTENDE